MRIIIVPEEELEDAGHIMNIVHRQVNLAFLADAYERGLASNDQQLNRGILQSEPARSMVSRRKLILEMLPEIRKMPTIS